MQITINKQIHLLPTSWEELSQKQQKYIVKALRMDSEDMLKPQELLPTKRLLIVQHLLNLDIHFMREWEREHINNFGAYGQLIFQSELHEIVQSAGFLFKKPTIRNGMEKYPLKKQIKPPVKSKRKPKS